MPIDVDVGRQLFRFAQFTDKQPNICLLLQKPPYQQAAFVLRVYTKSYSTSSYERLHQLDIRPPSRAAGTVGTRTVRTLPQRNVPNPQKEMKKKDYRMNLIVGAVEIVAVSLLVITYHLTKPFRKP